MPKPHSLGIFLCGKKFVNGSPIAHKFINQQIKTLALAYAVMTFY